MKKILKKNKKYKKLFKIKKNKILFNLKQFAQKKLLEAGLQKIILKFIKLIHTQIQIYSIVSKICA